MDNELNSQDSVGCNINTILPAARLLVLRRLNAAHDIDIVILRERETEETLKE
jgi:hypothetical protein